MTPRGKTACERARAEASYEKLLYNESIKSLSLIRNSALSRVSARARASRSGRFSIVHLPSLLLPSSLAFSARCLGTSPRASPPSAYTATQVTEHTSFPFVSRARLVAGQVLEKPGRENEGGRRSYARAMGRN